MPKPSIYLIWKDDKGDHRFALSSGQYTLGRSKECDIQIDHKGISKTHAKIHITKSDIKIEDANSSAGTFFNGDYLNPGQSVLIAENDRFQMGRITLMLTRALPLETDQPAFPNLEIKSSDTEKMLLSFDSLLKQLKSNKDHETVLEEMEALYPRLERELIQYRVLQKVTQVLGQILDIKTVLKAALKLVGEELGAERGFIVLYDSAVHKMNSMVTWHFDLTIESSKHDYAFSHTLATRSVTSGKIIIIDNAMKDPQFSSSHSIIASKIQSVICIPLYRGTDVLGVIYLDSLTKSGQFENVHEAFLQTFARQASMALHNAKLYTQAITDDLSGLFLRKYVKRRIREEIARVNRHGRHFCILMIDIDFFKNVNDTYGHQAGDMVISEIAKRLLKSAREMDVVGRFGGEEFIMLLPETSTKGGFTLAERIRKRVSQAMFHVENRTFSVTTSIGIATSTGTGPSMDEVISRADKALYRAKSSGRNCSIVWESDQGENS